MFQVPSLHVNQACWSQGILNPTHHLRCSCRGGYTKSEACIVLQSKITGDYKNLNINLCNLFYIYDIKVLSIMITYETIQQMLKYRDIGLSYPVQYDEPWSIICDFFCVAFWECGGQGDISPTIFPTRFKFNGNQFCSHLDSIQLITKNILHMTQQLCCCGMCKVI